MIQRHGSSLWKISLFFMGMTVGLLLLIPIALFIPGRPQPEPVQLVESTYVPFSGCPGDVVDSYAFSWHIKRPAVLLVTVAHLRAPEGDTIQPARLGETFVTAVPTERFITDNDASFVIPDLPPGWYERVIGINTMSGNSKPAFLVLPYEVRNDCGD